MSARPGFMLRFTTITVRARWAFKIGIPAMGLLGLLGAEGLTKSFVLVECPSYLDHFGVELCWWVKLADKQ